MVKRVAIGLVVLLAAVLVYAATRPDTFRVERSARIPASPERIFPLIDDLHRWGAWSPWEKMDPAMQRTFSGAASGKGAVYAWDGNRNIGAGRMEITETTPPSRVAIKLDFVRPMRAENIVEFTLRPEGDHTIVTWAMQGHNSYFSKVLQLFLDMDHMVGGQFEQGLANLETVATR